MGCHKGEQPPVQPEEPAATSASATPPPRATASALASASVGATAPLIPYADGQGPSPGGLAAGSVPSPDGGVAASPDGVRPTATGRAMPPTIPPPDPGRLELISAGSEPRQTLRFAPKVGQVDALSMTMKVGMAASVGDKKVPSGNFPPMMLKLTLKVAEVTPDGDIAYDFLVTGADAKTKGLPADQARLVQKGVSGLVGLGGRARVTGTGITRDVVIKPPKGGSAQLAPVMQSMEQAMNEVLAPLPEEAVGKGAKWKFVRTARQSGVLVTQTATYELLGVKPGKIKLGVELEQTAPRQAIRAPNGARLELMALQAKGTGKRILRLVHLSPQRSAVAISSRTQMAIPDQGVMTIDTSISIDMTGR
ncbi:MAG: hypothetical protein AAGN82_25720 [Myxococcota bacterium]